ncbi:MAG: nickel pincer cofactor biosynthesis protein LarC [Lentisphaeraceae bacterium]|nr:nickel pincer cofactor biosynthesis protein LarC [Lentisphaeraceae bacterium]
MRILLLDPFSGLAGDMFTAALLDLGVDRQEFLKTLNGLKVEGCHAEIEETIKSGISSLKFNVVTPLGIEGPGGKFKKKFSPVTINKTKLVKQTDHAHSHRSLTQVLEIIDKSSLPTPVKDLSRKIFIELGKAEASIHGMTLENVHFHEVGAADAIYDICGASLAFHMLNIEKFVCRPLAVGGGVVNTAHGFLPVPAPATARLLEGIPTKVGPAEKELTTPTGAAIIKALATSFENGADGSIVATGYGAGTLSFPTHANVLKATLLENNSESSSSLETDEVKLIQCNIDDMPGEILSALIPNLLKQGALDVTCTPCMMKKNRQAFTLEVICHESELKTLAKILLCETSTFGVRYQTWNRFKLDRKFEKVMTEHGEVSVKIGLMDGEIIKISPEFDSCLALSELENVPVTQIYSAAQAASYPLLKKN